MGKPEFQVAELSQHHVSGALEEDRELQLRVAEVAYQFGIDQARVRDVLHVLLRDELLRRRPPAESG